MLLLMNGSSVIVYGAEVLPSHISGSEIAGTSGNALLPFWGITR